MRKTIITITAAAFAVLSVSSCKKDDDNNITLTCKSALLVGNWKEVYDGYDDDGNNVWDSAEKNAVPDSIAISLVMNSNGTGSSTQHIFGATFYATTVWSLVNNEQDIKLVATIPGTAPNTFYYNIVSLDSNEFVFRDTTQTPVQYGIFRRK
jgi:hypothetical protein